MKKLVIGIIGGVVVIGAGAAVIITLNNRNKATVTNTTTGQSVEVKTGSAAVVNVNACDVLTQAIADEVLGATSTKGDTSAGNASSDDVSVTNCTYTVKIDPNAVKANNTRGVSVLVRSAKTSAGAETNNAQFSTNKPAGVQDVSGLGEKAYYNPTYKQLNVLKNGNWYIITSYNGAVTSATLESDQALANKLSFK